MRSYNKLIYDIGMHNGDDTAYYLYKGFRVIAVEANPLLVKQARERFKKEIRENKLIIINAGISNKRGRQTFWVNEIHDEWSSFVKEMGCRNNTACHSIRVKTVRFRDIYNRYGKPYYLKIDIEKNDVYCLEDLTADTAPQYISIEAHRLEYLFLLHQLGYTQFKCIDQLNHNDPVMFTNEQLLSGKRLSRQLYWSIRNVANKSQTLRKLYKERTQMLSRSNQTKRNGTWIFPPGSSGPLGEETFDEWQNLEDLTYNWLHAKKGYGGRGTLDKNSWFDFHAKK